ncbi:hypothetical protein QE422_000137 [Chryseobacterium sp. SORGH_AS 447]|nr:hypothetical protein [Chryseobacterium sp. SORGH_AS_0447]
MTEKPVTNTIPTAEPQEQILVKGKEGEGEIQAPESPTQI